MARIREFNEEEVLKAIAKIFAEYGYAGTSIDQLVKASGLKRGSLYQAFQSKGNIFRKSFSYQAKQFSNEKILTDLLIVAIWERAAVDVEVKNTVTEVISKLELTTSKDIASLIFARMEERLNPKNSKQTGG